MEDLIKEDQKRTIRYTYNKATSVSSSEKSLKHATLIRNPFQLYFTSIVSTWRLDLLLLRAVRNSWTLQDTIMTFADCSVQKGLV